LTFFYFFLLVGVLQDSRKRKQQLSSTADSASIEDWLEKRRKCAATAAQPGISGSKTNTEQSTTQLPTFCIPDTLKGFQNLPPSLIPPSLEDILAMDVIFNQWG